MQMWGTVAVPCSLGEEDWSIWDYENAVSPLCGLDFLAVRNMAEKGQGVPACEEQVMEEENAILHDESETSEEEKEEEELFEVECLLGKKVRGGRVEYRVRWKGYSKEHDTWEPEDNLHQVLDMVEEFNKKEDEKKKARKEERLIRKAKMEGKKLPGEESPESDDTDDEITGLKDPFFKLLEKGQVDVFSQDLYSKVKSRAAMLAAKEREKKKEQAQAERSSSREQRRAARNRGQTRGGSRHGGRGRGEERQSPKDHKVKNEDSENSSLEAPEKPLTNQVVKSGSRATGKRDTRKRMPTATTRKKKKRTSERKARCSRGSWTVSPADSSFSSTGDSFSENSSCFSVRRDGKAESPPSSSTATFVVDVAKEENIEVIPYVENITTPSPGTNVNSPAMEASPAADACIDSLVAEEVVEEEEVVAEPDTEAPVLFSAEPSCSEIKEELMQSSLECNVKIDEQEVIPVLSQRGKKNKRLPRKRKSQETDTRLSDTSSSGSVSPAKPQTPPDPCSSSQSSPDHENRSDRGNDINSLLDESSQEKRLKIDLSGAESEEDPLPQLTSPSVHKMTQDKKVEPLLLRLHNESRVHFGIVAEGLPDDRVYEVTRSEPTRIGLVQSKLPKKDSDSAKPTPKLQVHIHSSIEPQERSRYSVAPVPAVSTFSETVTVQSETSSQNLSQDSLCLETGSVRHQSTWNSGKDPAHSKLDAGKSGVTVAKHNVHISVTQGKENADRLLSTKSVAKKKEAEGTQPLETILNSSLLSESDKSRNIKGYDDFEFALEKMDLADIEDMILPPVIPLELSDEELKQSVLEGDLNKIDQALVSNKLYNLNQADHNGCTLLMHAVLKGYDEIANQLLCHGADIQIQQHNGYSAVMLAVECGEFSTVALLLDMGANINATDIHGETALIKAVKRGDKQILKLLLENGSNFTMTTQSGYSALQLAKVNRLADIETTLIDHITRVVAEFERQILATLKGTASLHSSVFPIQCFPLRESNMYKVTFKHMPTQLPSGVGFLLFIAHACFNGSEVKCRLYGQCAVTSVYLNGILQPSLTQDSNFVLMCHPLLEGRNELVVNIKRDLQTKANLLVCAYKAQLLSSHQ